MGKDATPDYIEVKNEDFSNDNHREVASILVNEWNPNSTIKNIAEEYGAEGRSESLFRNVYYRYLGFDDQKQFADGLDDPRTIQEIKRDHGRVKEYIDKRKEGEISENDYRVYLDQEDLEPREPPEHEERILEGMVTAEKAIQMSQKAYRQGWEDRGRQLD